MIYFHLLSDVHLEHCKHYCMKKHLNINNRNGIDENDEINLILAGDIGHPETDYYKKYIKHCSMLYNNVFIIAGNHEYYNKSIEETDLIMNKLEENNIYYINNKMFLYKDIYIIGSTLWTYIDDNSKQYSKYINDYIQIKNFDVDKNNILYDINYRFLEESINRVKQEEKKCIIVTHHMPSFKAIHEKYKNQTEYSPFFASNCDKLIDHPVLYWLYGHTHTKNITQINNIDVICNPKGYPDELSNYDKKLFIKI